MVEMKNKKNTSLTSQSRRKFIYGCSAVLGATASTVVFSSSALSMVKAPSLKTASELFSGRVFSYTQLQLLEQICNIVLPKTDTLGAADIQTHIFIDKHLYHCCNVKTQQKVKQVIELIAQRAESVYSNKFINLNEHQQFALLTDLDLGQNHFDQNDRSDFKLLKQLICFGYYTAEVGASQEHRYVAVPGGFIGSIPYKPYDPSWGSQGLFY